MKNLYKYYKERMYFAPAIKMFNNGIPLKCDTWSSCKNACRYCFAEELRKSTLSRVGIQTHPQVARFLNLKQLSKKFEESQAFKDENTPFINWSIRNKYFIELGTMGETFQEADLDFRVTYNFFRLMSEYKMPIFINTKLNLVCYNEEYKKLLTEHKAPIIICLTLTTVDDKLGKLYEPLSPLPSQRLKTIKELGKYDHIKTIVYISPFMPGVTDIDIPTYMGKIMDAGIISAHLRDFFMQGKKFQNSFWQQYVEKNKDDLEAFFGGYHATYESKRRFFLKAQEYASKRDPNFIIVGMKSKWFELNPHHGKMNYDILPESFKQGITDFTAIPIMRKVRENKDTPQLLKWTKIGHKNINIPTRIRTNEGGINNLMEGLCNCNTSDFNYEMTGKDWLIGGLWNGYTGNKPDGFFAHLDYIFPVKHSGDYVKDEEGNYVYAYLPKKDWNLLRDDGQHFLFTPEDTSEMKNPSIDYNIAKEFLIPTRKGDISDKWNN
jgi:DNA repair photolyase